MSAIIQDVQKQDPASAVIILYEIELSSSSTIYFHDGKDSSIANIQMRDKDTPSTIRTYTALPIQMTGFSSSSSGKIPRPVMTIANVLTTFSDTIGTLTNDDLLGKKVIRRKTLAKYLDNGSGNSNSPAVEFPKQIWVLDRIKAENANMIQFELAAPHDLIGVTIPKRNAISNACAWPYKGANADVAIGNRVGACNVDTQGRIAYDGTTYTNNWVNVDDERVISSTIASGTSAGQVTAYSGVSSGTTLTLNAYYTTTTSAAVKYNTDGSESAVGSYTEYWICKKVDTKANAGTPSDSSAYFDRIRVFTAWSSSTDYLSYTNDSLNDYVEHTVDSVRRLWKCKFSNKNQTPGYGSYWEMGDACSKTLKGCQMRYNSEAITTGTASSNMKASVKSDRYSIPFGGFPGAKRYS